MISAPYIYYITRIINRRSLIADCVFFAKKFFGPSSFQDERALTLLAPHWKQPAKKKNKIMITKLHSIVYSFHGCNAAPMHLCRMSKFSTSNLLGVPTCFFLHFPSSLYSCGSKMPAYFMTQPWLLPLHSPGPLCRPHSDCGYSDDADDSRAAPVSIYHAISLNCFDVTICHNDQWRRKAFR